MSVHSWQNGCQRCKRERICVSWKFTLIRSVLPWFRQSPTIYPQSTVIWTCCAKLHMPGKTPICSISPKRYKGACKVHTRRHWRNSVSKLQRSHLTTKDTSTGKPVQNGHSWKSSTTRQRPHVGPKRADLVGIGYTIRFLPCPNVSDNS